MWLRGCVGSYRTLNKEGEHIYHHNEIKSKHKKEVTKKIFTQARALVTDEVGLLNVVSPDNITVEEEGATDSAQAAEPRMATNKRSRSDVTDEQTMIQSKRDAMIGKSNRAYVGTNVERSRRSASQKCSFCHCPLNPEGFCSMNHP